MSLSKSEHRRIDISRFSSLSDSENLTISDGEFFYIFGYPLENVTFFVSETYPNSGQKPPEIETLVRKTLVGRNSDSGHGRPHHRSGNEARHRAIRMAPAPSSGDVGIAGFEEKCRRKLGFRRYRSSAVKRSTGPLGIERGEKILPTAGGAPLRRRL